MKQSIEEIAQDDGRFAAAGIIFVYEGLGFTVKKHAQESGEHTGPQHVSGRDLSHGLKELALERYGRLAKTVLARWGIHSTRDFGEIVYMMIENQWMSAQPNDSIDDFNDVFDFQAVFESEYQFNC